MSSLKTLSFLVVISMFISCKLKLEDFSSGKKDKKNKEESEEPSVAEGENTDQMPKSHATGDTRTTSYGKLLGIKEGKTYAFKGIPYAKPPVGDLRWRAPKEPDSWEGVKDAKNFGPRCAQKNGGFGSTAKSKKSEDCLYLNIWTPGELKDSQFVPVMLFVHGGSLAIGASNEEYLGTLAYDGQYLADTGNVVVVTINYRIGALGFLALPDLAKEEDSVSGNFGLYDQIAALKWVQKNIQDFGGNAKKVMFFGESAGGWSVCAHLASPLSKDLFTRAAIESGDCTTITKAEAESRGVAAIKPIGCNGAGKELLECLRGKDADTISLNATADWRPVIDGKFLTKSPQDIISQGKHIQVPIIVGSNSQEAVFERITYKMFTSKVLEIVGLLTKYQEEPVYRYFFDPPQTLAIHGSELFYVFGTERNSNFFGSAAASGKLSNAMMLYWSAFADTGKPEVKNLPTWPKYTAEKQQYIDFTWPIKIVN